MEEKLTKIFFSIPLFFDAIKQFLSDGKIEVDLSLFLIAVATSFGGSLLQIFEKKREGKLRKHDIPYIITSGAFITFIIYEIGNNTKLSNYIAVASALGGYMSLDLLYGIKKTGSMLKVFLPDAIKSLIKNWVNHKEDKEDENSG